MSVMLNNQHSSQQPYGNYHLRNVHGFLGVTGQWNIYLFLIHFVSPWKVKKCIGYGISHYNKSKIHLVMTDRLRRDCNEHMSSSKFDCHYIEFKNYFVNISANWCKKNCKICTFWTHKVHHEVCVSFD
jgi:hypothetical protein